MFTTVPSSVTTWHLLTEGEGFDGCTIVYTKGDYMVPFQGSTERAPTKTKKLSLVVKQKKLNNLRDKVKFWIHFVPLNMT